MLASTVNTMHNNIRVRVQYSVLVLTVWRRKYPRAALREEYSVFGPDLDVLWYSPLQHEENEVLAFVGGGAPCGKHDAERLASFSPNHCFRALVRAVAATDLHRAPSCDGIEAMFAMFEYNSATVPPVARICRTCCRVQMRRHADAVTEMHSSLLQERFLAVLAGHVRTHIIFAGHGSCLVGVRSAANEGPHQHRISTASAPARFPVTVPTPEPEAEAERRPHGSPRARVQAEACAGACGLPAAVERRPEDGIRRCFVLHPSGSEQSSCDGSKHDDDDDDKAHEDPPACSPVVCLLVPPADRTYPHVRSTAPPFPTPYSSSSYGLESFSFLLPPSSFPPSLSLVPPLPSTLPGLGASAGRSDGDGKRAIQAQGSSIRAPGLVPPLTLASDHRVPFRHGSAECGTSNAMDPCRLGEAAPAPAAAAACVQLGLRHDARSLASFAASFALPAGSVPDHVDSMAAWGGGRTEESRLLST
ncbi:hypothetical protein RJ55_02759 [Drechmeria coniospora]|nr:hypothetical protein RJ55_02759 [Drechmeria coniospora]